jgi:hypothetical protein
LLGFLCFGSACGCLAFECGAKWLHFCVATGSSPRNRLILRSAPWKHFVKQHFVNFIASALVLGLFMWCRSERRSSFRL